ncbi:MAG: type II secretion system protein N [Hyphomonas sp.]|nr:type II secretion system protein N [Hyphomonas sp.]
MIRFLFLIIVLAIGGVIALAFVPLATALKLSGASDNGVAWSAARGTIFSGGLDDLTVNGTNYGNADLTFDPSALLKGTLQYAVAWTGAHGEGKAKVSVDSGQLVTLKDYVINLDLRDYERAAKWIRQAGGGVKLEGPKIQFQGSECILADGVATSDVLDRNREILGSGWSDLRGDLACDEGKLLVPLESENAAGTRFSSFLRVAPGTPGKFEARISGRISRALGFALPLAGFTRDGEEFVYAPRAAAPAP